VVPVTIALRCCFGAGAFLGLQSGSHGLKRELVTDLCYWFLVPLFGPRLPHRAVGARRRPSFRIHDADELIAFYDNGHGPLSALPLWVQAVLFLCWPIS